MKTELLQLEVRVDGESGKPFICDQHGRRVAGMIQFNAEVPSNEGVAFVTMTAHLFSKGKKYTARNTAKEPTL